MYFLRYRRSNDRSNYLFVPGPEITFQITFETVIDGQLEAVAIPIVQQYDDIQFCIDQSLGDWLDDRGLNIATVTLVELIKITTDEVGDRNVTVLKDVTPLVTKNIVIRWE